MSLLDRLKQGLVRTNSSGAFPVTEEDIINYQREQQARTDQRARSEYSSSSSCSKEDDIVIVRVGEDIETRMLMQTFDYDRIDEGKRCPFDMSLLRGRTSSTRSPEESSEDNEVSSGDFVDAIEFMDDNASQGDNVLLLRHQMKPGSVRRKARKVITRPFRSGLHLFKAIGERLRVFRRKHFAEPCLWTRKRRYLDRTASMNGSEEQFLEFERSSSLGYIEDDTLELPDS